jgi:hypothetical protein
MIMDLFIICLTFWCKYNNNGMSMDLFIIWLTHRNKLT